MGTAVMDMMSATYRPVRQFMDELSQPSREEEIRQDMEEEIYQGLLKEMRQGLEETNEHVLKVIADWREFLQLLEQNPQNYKSMCRDGDVEKAIAGLEKTGKRTPSENWTSIGRLLSILDADTYEKFKVVDKNARICSALLREVSWNLLILDREHKPSTGPSYSIDEAIANLRS